jgi:hypothetical protein
LNRHRPYSRHGTAHKPGYRVHWQDSFFGHSVHWRARQRPPLTHEEELAIAHRILIEHGFVYCLRCTRGWIDAHLDAEARRLGVAVVRVGEAALEVCPRCAPYARLLTCLTQRLGTLLGGPVVSGAP